VVKKLIQSVAFAYNMTNARIFHYYKIALIYYMFFNMVELQNIK